MRPRNRPALRRRFVAAWALAWGLTGCVQLGGEATLADLDRAAPDLREVEVGDGLAQAMEGYRQFLESAPESALTPEAMRRLADLALEKSYGSLGAGTATERAAADAGSRPAAPAAPALDDPASEDATTPMAAHARISDDQVEARAFADASVAYAEPSADVPDGSVPAAATGPAEALALYDRILENYSDYAYHDQVLYQKARALDELGRVDEAIAVADRLIADHPDSRHLDELLFRRGEYHFVRRRFFDAESSYASIVALGPASDYYELALYKLGWSLYKQMMLEEALQSFVMLLDHKVATGYDFDQVDDEAQMQRVADTHRVISLCFSELGGAEVVAAFFDTQGARPYEHRIYRELGEFFLDKLRYADAAGTYQRFMQRDPMHAVAPRFSMRVVEIYEAGDFPKLVLEAKRSFAEDYGVASLYWQHHDITAQPEVLAYLETNLRDLATHAHALYQSAEDDTLRPTHFEEATRWYREYLASFPEGAGTPGLHRRYADLLLEDERFPDAADAFETVAYDYAAHADAAEAGYAAVYARREQYERMAPEAGEPARRAVVGTSLRFAETFPEDERAVVVLGAAADDLYALGDHAAAIEQARRLIASWPDSEPAIRRGAWLTVGHASFDSERFEDAEEAYLRVESLSAPEDEDVADNLAAAIYKQGERAEASGDARGAADHFLRIATHAPDSAIRPKAEYDAAAALIALEDWSGAAEVLEAFRSDHPDHALQRDVSRQMAHVRQSSGNLAEAAIEYERVAREAETREERADALTVAGDLHEEAGELRRALDVFATLVTEYLEPIERLVVTRFKMAEIHGKLNEDSAREEALRHVVELDAGAGAARTPVVRGLAARAALELAEPGFDRYAAIALNQPFDRSLATKKRSLERLVDRFEALVDYGVGEVTAAATFYIAEAYGEFGEALLESERPADLSDAERLDYDDILLEQAYPFEERTIEIHEKNLELARTGVANPWVERSLSRLGALSPGRYAKQEVSVGPLESLDAYVYRRPAPRAPEPAADAAQVAEHRADAVTEDATAPPLSDSGSVAVAPDATNAPPASTPPAALDAAASSAEEDQG